VAITALGLPEAATPKLDSVMNDDYKWGVHSWRCRWVRYKTWPKIGFQCVSDRTR